jgi:hypothetical protein
MNDGYKVEFYVPLWDYVLILNGQIIPLNQTTIREAQYRARIIVEGKRRNEKHNVYT